jgi:hypothetical protein
MEGRKVDISSKKGSPDEPNAQTVSTSNKPPELLATLNMATRGGASTFSRISENRGRPRKWTRGEVEKLLRRAVRSYRKKKYRSPTLKEAASEINMPVANLKKLMLRHKLRYLTYKKET